MSTILEIYICETNSSSMLKKEQAELEAGKGIIGDRYYNDMGTFSEKLAGLPDKELTLIESEEIENFNIEHGFNFNFGDFRRNIVTKGIRLNQLEGKQFMLGGVRVRGVRLCEPCAHLASILVPDIVPALAHKAGLRAQIISSGTVRPGDQLQCE